MPRLLLDLRHLRYAFAASESGSLRRTAEVLGISQSTLTRRIQLLEAELGTQIFRRTRMGVEVTPEGERFLASARVQANLLDQSAQELGRSRAGHTGEIRVGVTSSLTGGFLRRVLGQFRGAHPNIRVRIEEDSTQAHIRAVLTDRLDIAFVAGSHSVVGCVSRPLWQERVLLVLPSADPLAEHDRVTWDQVKQRPFLVSEDGAGREIEDYIVRHISTIGFRPVVNSHRASRETLLNMVSLGMGITLTTESAASRSISDLSFRPIDSTEENVVSSGIWKADNPSAPLKRLVFLIGAAARRTTGLLWIGLLLPLLDLRDQVAHLPL